MTDIVSVKQALVDRSWYSIPVLMAHRTVIEFHFEADDTGWSRYSIRGHNDIVPDIIEATWRYAVNGKELELSWDDNTSSSIGYELTFEKKMAYSDKGEPNPYDAVLRVAMHLFPKSSGFPDGWLKDYWGRPR